MAELLALVNANVAVFQLVNLIVIVVLWIEVRVLKERVSKLADACPIARRSFVE